MTFQNAEIAAALDEIADLLEIQGANPFRVRAYRGAARTVAREGRRAEHPQPGRAAPLGGAHDVSGAP